MNTPYTQTLTLNTEDHPLTFTLERDINGGLSWRIIDDGVFRHDRDTLRYWLLQLAATGSGFFYTVHPDLAAAPVLNTISTDPAVAAQTMLASLTSARDHAQATLDAYRQLLAKQQA